MFGVGSGGAGIYIFRESGQNQAPVGYLSLTGDGYSSAYLDGLAVDSSGTLYIGDMENSTVLEYPKNQTKPDKILTGAVSPVNVIVDRKGTVYVASIQGQNQGAVYRISEREHDTKSDNDYRDAFVQVHGGGYQR